MGNGRARRKPLELVSDIDTIFRWEKGAYLVGDSGCGCLYSSRLQVAILINGQRKTRKVLNGVLITTGIRIIGGRNE